MKMIKNIKSIKLVWVGAFVLGLLTLSNDSTAQGSKRDFIASNNDGWMVNVEEAYKQSEATNRPILANFTGSDWCGWCIKLKKEVFSKPIFQAWAAENVILLELDYPRKTKLPVAQTRQNAELQQIFRIGGFPSIWVFDLDNNSSGTGFEVRTYGNTGYVAGGPKPYIKNLEKMIALKAKGVN